MDFAEVSRQADAITKNVREMIKNDHRTRMLIDYAYIEAREKMGRYVDPENADDDARKLAMTACWFLAACIFTEDAEIHALRTERDHYKKLAEKALMISPMQPTVISTRNAT